jgi:hypothetical protein
VLLLLTLVLVVLMVKGALAWRVWLALLRR